MLRGLVRDRERQTTEKRGLGQIGRGIPELRKQTAPSYREQRASEEVQTQVAARIERPVGGIHVQCGARPDIGTEFPGALEMIVDVEVRVDIGQAVVRPEQNVRREVEPGAVLLEFQMTAT